MRAFASRSSWVGLTVKYQKYEKKFLKMIHSATKTSERRSITCCCASLIFLCAIWGVKGGASAKSDNSELFKSNCATTRSSTYSPTLVSHLGTPVQNAKRFLGMFYGCHNKKNQVLGKIVQQTFFVPIKLTWLVIIVFGCHLLTSNITVVISISESSLPKTCLCKSSIRPWRRVASCAILVWVGTVLFCNIEMSCERLVMILLLLRIS